MNLKQKAKTYSFWISIISAVLIVVRILGEHFGWAINESLIMDIVTGVCGILVLLGILSSPAKKDESMEETIKNLTEQSKQIQSQQQQLNQTIKTDIAQKQLSIEEQIALLKQNAQKQANVEHKTVDEITSAETIETPVSDLVDTETEEVKEVFDVAEDYGIVYVPETEVIAPVDRTEVQEYIVADNIAEPDKGLTDDAEEVLLGVESTEETMIEMQGCTEVIQSELEEVITQDVIGETQQTEKLIQNQEASFSMKVAEETTLPQTEETIEKSVIDFSKLSNDELKDLLIEVLQRL